MSNCCATEKETTQPPKRYACPNNGKQYPEVPYATVLHHVREPWKKVPKQQTYYYCDDPDCDVVYFGLDNSTILKHQLRTKVGIKETSDDALICYCFDVSKAHARTDNHAKAFVIAQTKGSTCDCATRNPSGRCCLKDFPKDY